MSDLFSAVSCGSSSSNARTVMSNGFQEAATRALTHTLSLRFIRSFVDAVPLISRWNCGRGLPSLSHGTFSPVSLFTAWNFPVDRSSQTTGFRGGATEKSFGLRSERGSNTVSESGTRGVDERE